MATITGFTAAHTQALIDAHTAALALKADLVSGKVAYSQLPTDVAKIDTLFINVQDHGVVGDGTTDDTTAIQAVLNSAAAGATVFFPKTYATITPIKIPPQIRVLGNHGAHVFQLTNPTFKPKSTFTGASVLLLVDQTTGSYSTASYEQRIENITLDLSNVSSAATLDAIQAQGYVHGVYIKDVGIYKCPSHGINAVSNGSGIATSWRVVRVHVNNPYGSGINATINDTTWTDCEVINGGFHGWTVGGSANSVFNGCRAEFNLSDGFNFISGTGTGAGSGGPIFVGCSTDRNANNGVSVPSAATGHGPSTFTGCSFRRDGSASTSAGYAGININASTIPIVLDGCQVFPGTTDAGTGNATPQYGLSATSANVQVNGGIWHAISEGIHDGGSNVRLARSVNVFERTGTTASPTTVTRGVQTNGANGGSLDVPVNLAGLATPSAHGAIAWVADPNSVSGTATPSNGIVFLSAVYVSRSVTATKLFWAIATAGVTPTSSQNFVGLYDSAGTRLANVNIDARVTSAGMFTETISAALTPGWYWVAWVFNATTRPDLHKVNALSTNGTASILNFNLSASGLRAAINGSALTALPSPLTVASNATGTAAFWAALA